MSEAKRNPQYGCLQTNFLEISRSFFARNDMIFEPVSGQIDIPYAIKLIF